MFKAFATIQRNKQWSLKTLTQKVAKLEMGATRVAVKKNEKATADKASQTRYNAN
jgi:hypothetical protein